MAHGCQHRGTDFWPRNKECSRCLGLPEELCIVRTALARNLLPMAVTSADRCWGQQDFDRVEKAVAHVYTSEGLDPALPLYAFGASSGGEFVGALAGTSTVGREKLKCRIPQIMGISDDTVFSTLGPDGKEATWTAPPTVFIHMPVRDKMTAEGVAMTRMSMRASGVPVAEFHCKPLPITDNFFAERMDNVTLQQSKALSGALRKASLLDVDGQLRADPRREPYVWRQALLQTGVPQALEDSLEADLSGLSEEMNVAWAAHEMCASFASEMLEFCENPAEACKNHGWCDSGQG